MIDELPYERKRGIPELKPTMKRALPRRPRAKAEPKPPLAVPLAVGMTMRAQMAANLDAFCQIRFGKKLKDVMVQDRTCGLPQMRWLCYEYLVVNQRWSLTLAGRFFGKDHTTILHGLVQLQLRRDEHKPLADIRFPRGHTANRVTLPDTSPFEVELGQIEMIL